MKKLYLFLLGIFLLAGITALSYGYTHQNGSEVFYDDSGKIIGIHDQVRLQSRYPTDSELNKNDYIPYTLGQCLTDKEVTMFGTEWCIHCQRQKQLFGEDFNNVNYVDCDKDSNTCKENNIRGYPTWKINNKYYSGVRELNELSELTSCPI